MAKQGRKIRYAVVGLGGIAQEAVLPAFKNTRNSELAALVSSDPAKQKKLGRQYRIGRVYSYDEFEQCLSSGDIDAVYIAVPNHLHTEYTLAAARAGIHILCEKPMAVTEDECQKMIQAAREAHVILMIAYRLHFEAGNLEAIRIAQSGKLGDLRIFNSTFTQQVQKGNVRLQGSAGGGTVEDMGVYCINAARYLFRSEPIQAFASSVQNSGDRFREVDEMTAAVLRFPGDRLATFTSSFGAAPVSNFTLVGTKGSLRLEPAYEYHGGITRYLTIANGKTRSRTLPKRDQFGAELIYFSDCVLKNREPEPSGEEGLADVRIIQALRKSAEIGEPIDLSLPDKARRPTPALEISRPPVKEPQLVHAATPSGGN